MDPMTSLKQGTQSALEKKVGRREFIKVVTAAAAAIGLSGSDGRPAWSRRPTPGLKPSVIWLHFQECTGCTESLLRTIAPRAWPS